MFHHVKIDPGDYDFLGLHWCHVYVDTCLPIGIHYIHCHTLHEPGIDHAMFHALFDLMKDLGLTINEKKQAALSTKVVCLDVLIDTEMALVHSSRKNASDQ